MSPFLDFIGAKDDGGGGDNWSYKMCKLQSNVISNKHTQHFTGRMPFLSPNKQCQNTQGKTKMTKETQLTTSVGQHSSFHNKIPGHL